MNQDEIKCYHCNKTFYLNYFRFQCAKTVSCMFCGKRIIKSKTIKEENGIPPTNKLVGILPKEL